MSAESFVKKHFFELKAENPCFVAESPAMKDLYGIAKKLSESVSPVLIQGGRGTGKEAFARQIHLSSMEANGESALNATNSNRKSFFCVQGSSFKGLWEEDVKAFSGNTLFIRHIEDVPLPLQDEVLVLLKRNVSEKLGIKFIASSVQSLESLCEKGMFLPELYSRISMFPLRLPLLKDRKEDLLPLAESFLSFFAQRHGKNITAISSEAEKSLLAYSWPGNALELKTVIERAVLLEEGSVLCSRSLFLPEVGCSSVSEIISSGMEGQDDKTLKTALDTFKKLYITSILEENNWNQTKTSKVLDIQRTYLARLVGELNIRKKEV